VSETILQAREHGIEVKMVTGDNNGIARQISKQPGLGSDIHSADETCTLADATRSIDSFRISAPLHLLRTALLNSAF
jgi:magnesium-transporting ATPase (P-type)